MAPRLFARVPIVQAKQDLSDDSLANVCTSHSTHSVAASADWYLPGMHGMQVAAAPAGWLYPAGQSAQAVVSDASAARNLPALHLRQAADVLTAYMPAAQRTHCEAPASGPVVSSTAHSVHAVASCISAKRPGVHKSHAAWPT